MKKIKKFEGAKIKKEKKNKENFIYFYFLRKLRALGVNPLKILSGSSAAAATA
jgi:hypothetical protein